MGWDSSPSTSSLIRSPSSVGEREGAGLLLPTTVAMGRTAEEWTGLRGGMGKEGVRTALFRVRWELEFMLDESMVLLSVAWEVVMTL